MILLQLNPTSREPMFRQVVNQVCRMVDTGVLKPGERLPASRSLAEQLGVNRSTVYKAYQELWSMGYIDSRPGAYSVIRNRTGLVEKSLSGKASVIDWQRSTDPFFSELAAIQESFSGRRFPEGVINFTLLRPDSRLLPAEEYRRCVNSVLAREGASLLLYGDPKGHPSLREAIAGQMGKHQVPVLPEQILITNGAQEGLDLLLKLLVRPGSVIITETPTYALAIPLFRQYAGSLTGIPMNPEGMDLGELDRVLKQVKPAFIYTMPNFHNPTGITTSQDHRERLLALCGKYRVPLVEDGFEEEMKYFSRTVLPIKSMDHGQLVIYLGTFSKVLFPGLRIGWIAAPEPVIRMLSATKRFSSISGNPLDQAALELFIRQGYYDRHLKRIHRIYRCRMSTAIQAVRSFIPAGVLSTTRPSGGYTLWFEGRSKSPAEPELIQAFLGAGVAVSPGGMFYPEAGHPPAFRISIAQTDETEITEGIRRIGQVLAHVKPMHDGTHPKCLFR